MKRITVNKALLVSVIFTFAVATFTLPSCKKETECKGTVTVVDSTGNALSNSTVRLHASSVGGEIEQTQTTDGTGKTTFVFELPGIFDIEATHPSYPFPANGIIKLEEGETTEKTVQF